jgi:aminoglycoside/choline kinase family phosphotransferase
MRSAPSRRDQRIVLRASDEENETLRQNAATHQMSLSGFLREVGLHPNQWFRVRKLQQDIRQATVILNHIHQLHRLVPSEPKIQELIAQLAVLLVEMDTELNLCGHDRQYNGNQ